MFTWICPQCGREVPPSYTECPDCARKVTAAAESGEKAPAPAVVPQAPPLRFETPVMSAAPPRRGLPTWLLTIVSALAFGALVAAVYTAIQSKSGSSAGAAHATAAAPLVPPNPLLKQIEVTGLRLGQNAAQKTEVRFLVINHSGAAIQNFSAIVGMKARTNKNDEEPVGKFAFNVPSLGPYESKELTTGVETSLKVYELPDWQNLDLQIQVTSR